MIASERYDYNGRQILVREFEGLGEALAPAEANLKLDYYSSQDRSSITGTSHFTGTRNLEEAVDLAKNGWPEGLRQINEAAAKLDTSDLIGHSVLPEIRYAEAGDEADVGRYLDGEPDSMIEYQMPYSPNGNLLELVVDCGQSSNVPQQRIVERGAAILAAVQCLEMDGYSVGITMAEGLTGSGAVMEYYVPIKRAGQYLDTDALAFTVMNPSFLRRILFAIGEHESSSIRRKMGFYSGSGYGHLKPLEHIPATEYPQLVIGRHEAMEGGANAAQAILDRMIEKATVTE